MKAFRNLVSGEDDELTAAYAHFYKMVEREQGAVRNATLAGVEQLKKDVKGGFAITERTSQTTRTLVASTQRMHDYFKSKIVIRFYPLSNI